MTELMLEHVIGLSGKYQHTVQLHPQHNNIVFFSIGSVIVQCDLQDAFVFFVAFSNFIVRHNQCFYRHHDEEVTILSVAKSGKYMASAQLGTTKRKGNIATIIVWNIATQKIVHIMEGHSNRVLGLSFSHDDKFLLSCGEDCAICFWDMENGKIAGGQKAEKPVCFGMHLFICVLTWFEAKFTSKSNDFNVKRPKYLLVFATEASVKTATWFYDVKTMQFAMTSEACKIPGRIAGFKRTYSQVVIDESLCYFYAATMSGEVLAFSMPNALLRTSLPVRIKYCALTQCTRWTHMVCLVWRLLETFCLRAEAVWFIVLFQYWC